MAKSNYLPARDNDFLVWHDHFKDALTGVAATFGLSATDTAAVTDDNGLSPGQNRCRARHCSLSPAGHAGQDRRPTGDRAARARVCTAPQGASAYTPALGAQLGVEGREDATDLRTAKPELSATDQTGGVVALAFSKSKSDGVNLYSQRDGEAGFGVLVRDACSPYVDNRTLWAPGKSEAQRHRPIYMPNRHETGPFTDAVTITCPSSAGAQRKIF